VHPKYVQQFWGTPADSSTLDRYSHWIPSVGKHTARAMEDALENQEDAPGEVSEEDAL
jgi:hypothetical protein